MAEEQQELRQINWNELFHFTEIFKSFKMAIHPSKLLLTVAALVLLCTMGWVMDQVWSSWGGYVQAPKMDTRGRIVRTNGVQQYGEIQRYFLTDRLTFHSQKQQWLDQRRQAAAKLLALAEVERKTLRSYIDRNLGAHSEYLSSAFRDKASQRDQDLSPRDWLTILEKEADDSAWEMLDDAKDEFRAEVDKVKDLLGKSEDAAKDKIDNLGKKDRKKARRNLQENLATARAGIGRRIAEFNNDARDVRGDTIFTSFADYQWDCLSKAIASVCYGNITTGLKDYIANVESKNIAPAATVPQFSPSAPSDDPPGLLYQVLRSVHGFKWLIKEHWVYATIYLMGAMAICAVFGGAVNRMAAIQYAREEKISIKQSLRFSTGKFFSFFTAPLLPICIIMILGLLLFLGALLVNIPFVGPIIVGVLFGVAILLGLAIAFLMMGLVGGVALMYPTIAAEGSDSFDAISRSFSYVFSKPWRATFYGLVALFYGVITYLFVRLFALVALSATHLFVQYGVFRSGSGSLLSPNANSIDAMWTKPTFYSLLGPFSWDVMGPGELIGAKILWIWVFLVAAFVMAYLISFAASSSTIIYFLLRRKVDATDLDDVYVDEEELEEFMIEEPVIEDKTSEPSNPAEPTDQSDQPED